MLVENESKNLQAFDSSYFRGKSHFVDSGVTQNYFVFQPIFRYFRRIDNTDYVLEWKSKELSDESIKSPSVPNNVLDNSLNYLGSTIRAKFNRSCLKEGKITFNNGKTVNIYIVYEINKNCNISNDPALKNSFLVLQLN